MFKNIRNVFDKGCYSIVMVARYDHGSSKVVVNEQQDWPNRSKK